MGFCVKSSYFQRIMCMTILTGNSINPCFPSSSADLGATNSQNCIWGSFWSLVYNQCIVGGGVGSGIVLLAKEQRESKSNPHNLESFKKQQMPPTKIQVTHYIFFKPSIDTSIIATWLSSFLCLLSDTAQCFSLIGWFKKTHHHPN